MNQHYDKSPYWKGEFSSVRIPFKPHEVGVLVTHAGCPDARMAETILRFVGHGKSSYQYRNMKFETVYLSPGASKLPRDVSPNVFSNKNVLICDVTPARDLMDTIAQHSKEWFIMDHHNTDVNKSGGRCVYTDKCAGCALMWAFCHEGDSYGMGSNVAAPTAVRFLDAADRFDFTSVYDIFENKRKYNDNSVKAFHRYTKSLAHVADFAKFLCHTEADLDRWIAEGQKLREADAEKFDAIIQGGAFHPANSATNAHPESFFLIKFADHRLWNDIAEYYFDKVRGKPSTKAAAVFAIAVDGTGHNQVDVGKVKFSLRRDNFAAKPINVRDIAARYDGGGGLEGAASFTVGVNIYGRGVGTPAHGIPLAQCHITRQFGNMRVDPMQVEPARPDGNVVIVATDTYSNSEIPTTSMLEAAGLPPTLAVTRTNVVNDKVAFGTAQNFHYAVWAAAANSAKFDQAKTHFLFGGACPNSMMTVAGMSWPVAHLNNAKQILVSKDPRSGNVSIYPIGQQGASNDPQSQLLTFSEFMPVVGHGAPRHVVFALTSQFRLNEDNAKEIRNNVLKDPAAKIVEIYPKSGKLDVSPANMPQICKDIFDIVRAARPGTNVKYALVTAGPQVLAFVLGKEMQNGVFGGPSNCIALEYVRGDYHTVFGSPKTN